MSKFQDNKSTFQDIKLKIPVIKSKFQVIKLNFQDIKSKFRVIKSKFQVIKSKFRDLMSKFRYNKSKFQDIKSKFRVIMSKFRDSKSKFLDTINRNKSISNQIISMLKIKSMMSWAVWWNKNENRLKKRKERKLLDFRIKYMYKKMLTWKSPFL